MSTMSHRMYDEKLDVLQTTMHGTDVQGCAGVGENMNARDLTV